LEGARVFVTGRRPPSWRNRISQEHKKRESRSAFSISGQSLGVIARVVSIAQNDIGMEDNYGCNRLRILEIDSSDLQVMAPR
jgi:hypothetical protein